MSPDDAISASPILGMSHSSSLIRTSQLAQKLNEVRQRAEQEGQVYTNLPRERFADAKFDEAPQLIEFPPLRRGDVEIYASQSSSPFFSPVSDERMEMHRWTSSSSSQFSSDVYTALPFAEDIFSCTCCHSPADMRKIYLWEFVGNILTHACSVCGDSLASSPTVKALVPNYRFPVAHECDSCGWRQCLRCNIQSSVRKQVTSAEQAAVAATERRLKTQMLVLERRIEQLTPLSTADDFASSGMLDACKESILDLESRLGAERRSKDQVSALLSSLQKEYIQYKSDVEMHLESNAAEQVLLQSRLVEQSVLLADARARIDELSSIQRFGSTDNHSKTESMLLNENLHLKEEIDSLKVSIHLDFDNWKRGVMKQVKAECLKYRERLRHSLHIDTEDKVAYAHEDNEKELDYLFDEVDWTGGIEDLSPEKMKEYVEASRSSTPDHQSYVNS